MELHYHPPLRALKKQILETFDEEFSVGLLGLEEESDDDVEQEESSLKPLKIHLETLFEQQLFLGDEDNRKVQDTFGIF